MGRQGAELTYLDRAPRAQAKERKRNYAGTSPITRQPGKKKIVLARFVLPARTTTSTPPGDTTTNKINKLLLDYSTHEMSDSALGESLCRERVEYSRRSAHCARISLTSARLKPDTMSPCHNNHTGEEQTDDAEPKPADEISARTSFLRPCAQDRWIQSRGLD